MSAIADQADIGRVLCELEPIHVPGAIQPHGALLAVRTDNWRVSHASSNLYAIIGRCADTALGTALDDVVGSASTSTLRAVIDRGLMAVALPDIKAPGRGPLTVGATRVDGHVLLDIEPASNSGGQLSPGRLAQSVIQGLTASKTGEELCRVVVDGLKAVTGFDRVMAYRFAVDDHGEVIAENREPELPPFIGLRYPAGDIPPQARRLYVRQPVVAIANSAYVPVPLLVDAGLSNGMPLDLTTSALRSVSPVHRQYLRNMGAAATLSVGLVHGNRLWGMLVCHHATPRIADSEMRAAVALVGQVVSLLLEGVEQAEIVAARRTCDTILGVLMDKLRPKPNLAEALTASSDELLGLVVADGAVICLNGERHEIGHTLPNHAIDRVRRDQPVPPRDVLAMESLGLRFTDLASWAPTASGALLLPLTGDDNFIVWFRREACATIVWGGNPTEHVTVHPQTGELSPRASFSAWRETVRGRCAPWRDRDLIAARLLRRTLEAELRRRAVDGAFLCDSLLATGISNTQSSQTVEIRAGLSRQTRQDILDAVPDAMLVVDAKSHIVLANSRAERCFHYASGDLLGEHITAAIPGGINTLLSAGHVAPASDPTDTSALGSALDITGVAERVGVREDGTAFPIEIAVGQADTLEGVLAIACIRDISDRRAVEQQLAETELRSRSRFEAAPDSMVMVDGVGAITLMNRQAEIQFGYRRNELIGRHLTTIIVDGLSDPFSTTRDPSKSAVADDTRTYGLELSGRRKDGSVFPIDVQVGPLQNAEGIFVSAAIRDISARKTAEVELAQKVQELNRSNAELDKFAAIASHDLQEPLRMVASYTELLARRYKGRLDKDADDYIAYAVDGVRRMQQLIRDMLAYSRIAPPGTRLRTVSSDAALKQALLGLRAAIIQSRAVVTHDDLPLVVGDQMLLAQLFQNLVSNAIKYQRGAIPRVHVSAKSVEGDKYRFTVSDNGIGIDPRYVERIFGIFQRLHKREDYAGTGMGLAICKKIVEGHGGVIAVSSIPGEGSAFTFTVQQPAQ